MNKFAVTTFIATLFVEWCAAAPSAVKGADRMHGAARNDDFCMTDDYMDDTLTRIIDSKLVGLLGDTQGLTRFEASAITRAANGQDLLVVFDEYTSIAKLGPDVTRLMSPDNRLVPSQGGEMDSQFEGIALNPKTGTHYVVRETVDIGGRFYPSIWEVKVDEGSYELVRECLVNFELESDNAGFEGLEVVPVNDPNNSAGVLLLGICEGNHCADGNNGQDKGHGRIIASTYTEDASQGTCTWEPVKEIRIPDKANFEDYSDLAFLPGGRQLSVISQVESALFVADFDQELLEFIDTGKVYNFPRNARCEVQYCNVEGIVWLDDVRFAIASDKAKDAEPFFCLSGDQSVSVFSLPP